jgi:predicted RNA-binding protein associated with RNAse of E/G family
MAIHKPGKKYSNVPFGNKKNPLIYNFVSENILITTETWDESLPQTVNFGDDGEYKLIMKWEKDKNYAITKVMDGNNQLVSYYIDICSHIIKNGDIYTLTDWYLDVEKYPDKTARLLDEDEFQQAVDLSYLTQKEITTAQETAKLVLELVESNSLDF